MWFTNLFYLCIFLWQPFAHGDRERWTLYSTESVVPKLRCRWKNLVRLARRYEYDDIDLCDFQSNVEKRGFLVKDDLRAIARWKSPRSAGHIEKNSVEFVEEISRIALSAKDERTRIEVLTLLDGVQWPTASVILHFFHRDKYPIIDFRALWTVSMNVPNRYTFGYWWQYVEYCRGLAVKAGLGMRELDQALWQYSKENQKPV